jgi:hypothetical protein
MIGWSTCLEKCHDRAAKLWPYFDSYLARIHRPAALLRQIIGLVPVAFNNAALQPLFSSGLLVLFYYCLTLLPQPSHPDKIPILSVTLVPTSQQTFPKYDRFPPGAAPSDGFFENPPLRWFPPMAVKTMIGYKAY